MIDNRADYQIAGWCGIAGGVATKKEWALWAQNKIEMESALPRPEIKTIPSMMRRRLDTIGRCVMFVYEQCCPLLETEPAIISVSRHGNLPLLDDLIERSRAGTGMLPTAFTYSVHNRLSSLVSIHAGYRGVNGAYSSVRDGFPLAMSEALYMIADGQVTQALVIAYEAEIPKAYHQIISSPWSPHAAAFVLEKFDGAGPKYSLSRYADGVSDVQGGGSCFPLIRAMLNENSQRDGFWEYQYHE